MTARTIRRGTLRQKAPVGLTGGEGFRFENSVAARFLLDLLSGTNSLGSDFGRIVHLDWQARDAGWLTEDLAVTGKVAGTTTERSAGLSIKSDRQVTASGFPADFGTALWAQWLGVGTRHALEKSSDAVVLITAQLAQNIEAAWLRLLREASETTPERLVARHPTNSNGSMGWSIMATFSRLRWTICGPYSLLMK